MGGITYSKYFSNKVIKNYLIKIGYTIITGRMLLKEFGLTEKIFKDNWTLRGIAKYRFCYKNQEERDTLCLLILKVISSSEEKKGTYSPFYSLYITKDEFNSSKRLYDFHDCEVLRRHLNMLIKKEIEKL